MAEASERQRDKRRRIIDAAVDVFAEKGFGLSRVSDIARKAGVADGTIYLYFKNKEDILVSIFEEKMEGILEGLRTTLNRVDDPRDKLRSFATFHFDQLRKNPAVAEVLQAEMRLSNKFLKEYRPEKLWRYLDEFQQILEDGAHKGIFREDLDPSLSKWAFFGALDQLGMQWVLAKKEAAFSLETAARQVTDIFIRGLVKPADRPTQSEET